jgi:DNA anti-recombination protein RmuC
MKRATALMISAAVTALILVAVLAVAQAKTSGSTGDSALAAQPAAASTDPAALQQQLNDAYTLLQQREAQYQQRLQEAYAQLQTQNAGLAPRTDDEHEHAEHAAFRGDD